MPHLQWDGGIGKGELLPPSPFSIYSRWVMRKGCWPCPLLADALGRAGSEPHLGNTVTLTLVVKDGVDELSLRA